MQEVQIIRIRFHAADVAENEPAQIGVITVAFAVKPVGTYAEKMFIYFQMKTIIRGLPWNGWSLTKC